MAGTTSEATQSIDSCRRRDAAQQTDHSFERALYLSESIFDRLEPFLHSCQPLLHRLQLLLARLIAWLYDSPRRLGWITRLHDNRRGYYTYAGRG